MRLNIKLFANQNKSLLWLNDVMQKLYFINRGRKGYHPKNFPPSSHSRSQSDFPCQVVRFLFFFLLFLWAMMSMMPTIMIITPILLRLFVYCIFSFINCSVMNFSNIRGSKYFPVSLHLHDKCRCGPVVRLPVFPLIAIFCPALTC